MLCGASATLKALAEGGFLRRAIYPIEVESLGFDVFGAGLVVGYLVLAGAGNEWAWLPHGQQRSWQGLAWRRRPMAAVL